MDMAADAEGTYRLFKAKLARVPLQNLLVPNLQELIEQTINAVDLALILFKKDVMSTEKMKAFMQANESSSLFQNMMVYQSVIEKNSGETLIDALEQTGNFHIIQLLQSNLQRLDSSNNVNSTLLGQSQSSDIDTLLESFMQSTQNAILEGPGEKNQSSSDQNTTSQPTFKQISVLKKSSTKSIPRIRNPTPWNQTVSFYNLKKFGVKNLGSGSTVDSPLALVTTNTPCLIVSRTSRIDFNQTKFHAEERLAIPTFLESQLGFGFGLGFDLDKRKMTKPPQTMYLNTKSFTSQQWRWLSKLLFDHCRDTLENLWLDSVGLPEFSKGTEWLRTLEGYDEKPALWFSKLTLFIFQVQWPSSNFLLDSDTLHVILMLLKSVNYLLQDLWNESGIQIQIWRLSSDSDSDYCQFLMNPSDGTLCVGDLEDDLKDEIDYFLDKRGLEPEVEQLDPDVGTQTQITDIGADTDKKASTVVTMAKLYFVDPRASLFQNGGNPRFLTHLFLFNWSQDGIPVVNEVMNNLGEMKLLQKLGLRICSGWAMDLKQLDVLDNLSFVYLESTKVDCGGVGVDLFPWRPSIQTVVLAFCDFYLKTLEWSSSLMYQLTEYTTESVMLQRIEQLKNAKRPLPLLKVGKLSGQDANIRMMVEFFS